RFMGDNNVIKMPCPKLVEIVENDLIDDEKIVSDQLKEYYENINVDNIDSVVLGCTHFIFYRDYLKRLLPKSINLVDGNLGTCRHLKHILLEKNELNEENNIGKIEIYNSSEDQKYIKLSNKLLAR
ncbi:MAG: glutamate racemase, partial [Intestinibacter sp.]